MCIRDRLYLQLLHAKYPEALETILAGKLDDDTAAKLTDAANEISARYN